MAKKIASEVKKAGGRTFFVGGVVRDRLMGNGSGNENKDIDLEVHGLSVAELTEILRKFGKPLTKGAAFGVMGLEHLDLDIALPRSEKVTGKGHQDFEILTGPFLGPEKAASRRDFTVNALMEDVLTGEILDFFDGVADLRDKKIRHIDDEHFGEDPLRVFRAAQFASRFDFTIAPETIALAKKMDVRALSKERVMGELEKALLKAGHPSLFFENLKAMAQLQVWFPEMEALLDCPQDPVYHPEGDVWTHTMQVLDAGAQLKDEAQHPRALMFAALCHDLGKPLVTTEKAGRIHAYSHEREGLPVVEGFLHRLTGEKALIAYVLNMTKHHMQPNAKVLLKARTKSFMKVFDQSVCPEDLLLLAKADFLGRTATALEREQLLAEYLPIENELKNQLDHYHDIMARPCLMGRDLLEAGIAPGPVISDGLAYAHKLRLAGLSKEEQLKQTLGYLRK